MTLLNITISAPYNIRETLANSKEVILSMTHMSLHCRPLYEHSNTKSSTWWPRGIFSSGAALARVSVNFCVTLNSLVGSPSDSSASLQRKIYQLFILKRDLSSVFFLPPLPRYIGTYKTCSNLVPSTSKRFSHNFSFFFNCFSQASVC